MKSILKATLLVSVVVASTSAFAGRDDLQLNMQAQSNKAAAENKSGVSTSAVGKAQPLDHGPRATTNQWLAKQQQAASGASDTK